MIFLEMTKQDKINKLLKYKQSDGTIVLPAGMTLNNWYHINAKYTRPSTILDVVKEIEEEINEEKEKQLV